MRTSHLILLLRYFFFVFFASNNSAARPQNNNNETSTTSGNKQQPVKYIVHGVRAKRGEFPYYVQGLGCGGSLIWKDIVLTAAHCTMSLWKKGVLVGAYKFNRNIKGSERVKTGRSVKHPGYNKNMDNDFRVLHLKHNVKKSFPYAVLNDDTSLPKVDDDMTIIGMGQIAQNNYEKDPFVLKKANIKVINNEECKKLYDKGWFVKDVMVCGSSYKKDTCFGDSGGPAIEQITGTVVGLASWGGGCGKIKYPTVYARVASGIPFIKFGVCLLSRSPPVYCNERMLLEREEWRMRKLIPSFPAHLNCTDTAEEFDVSEYKVEDRDCIWLKYQNTTAREKFCQYLHVASRCQMTCEVCDLFDAATGLPKNVHFD